MFSVPNLLHSADDLKIFLTINDSADALNIESKNDMDNIATRNALK